MKQCKYWQIQADILGARINVLKADLTITKEKFQEINSRTFLGLI